MMAAAMAVSGERHIMHGITEADITKPRRLIREHHKRTGESHSLTAYVVARLARAVAEHPRLNSMRKRGKLILLDDVTIVTLVERNPEGERVVEYLSFREADKKSYRQIRDEIRAAQRKSGEPPGAISGLTWVRYIPSFLLRTFIHAMTRNVRWAKRYDVVGVSNIGMFGDGPGWGVSPSATVAVTVGGIASRRSWSCPRTETRSTTRWRAVKIMKTKERDRGKVQPGSSAWHQKGQDLGRRLPAGPARGPSGHRHGRTVTRPRIKQPSVEVPELERREA